MKRIEQLQVLSKEHHQSLVLAQNAIKTSMAGDFDMISMLCKKIVDEYPGVWMVHFKIEEESIFHIFAEKSKQSNTILQQGDREAIRLCEKLHQEHLAMNDYYTQMKAGNFSVLGEFGELLRQHTRTEERQLFPLLENLLTHKELDKVYQTSIKYRQI